MPLHGENQDYAAQLRALKQRSGRSYEALAAQLGTSSSALHRYCSGTGLPPDFAAIEAFGQLCGAQPDELVELYRAWVHADALRKSEPGHVVPEPVLGEAPPEPEPVHGEAPPEPEPVHVEAPPVSEPDTEPDTEPEPELASAAPRPHAGPETGSSAGRSRRRRRVVAGIAAVLVVTVGVVTAGVLASRPAGHPQRAPGGGCPAEVKLGEHDACVRTVQSLLARNGATITVDSDFGPETLKRVIGFQVLAGLPADGVVDGATRRALESGKTTMRAWTPLQVATLVREVFPEEPDHALGIARCTSFLDPLHVLPNSNGSRNWGVFQIADSGLAQLGGSPRQALDPEWNIRAARRLWAAKKNFSHWLSCDQPYEPLSGAPVTWSGKLPSTPFVACPPPGASPLPQPSAARR